VVPSRFLVAAIDGGGTLPPVMGVAAELVRRGHRVDVLADPTAEESARAAGCGFSPWRTAPHVGSVAEQSELVADLERGSPWRQLREVRRRLLVGPAGLFARDLLDTVTSHPADALLVEGMVPGILIGAEASRLPFAALLANVYVRPTVGLPPFGTGWSPAQGRLGQGRDALARYAIRRATGGMTPPLNAVRASYGLDRVEGMFEMLDRCPKVLVLTSPSFDFATPHLPPNVRYVGPQLDDPSWAGDWHDAADETRPLVLVALSSIYQNQTETLARIATALGRLPVQGLVTTGRAVSPGAVSAPANVRVVQAAPHGQLLPRAAAVITHAGHGTVLRTLAAGVPLVCLPMGRDQKDNTVRVLRLGAGVRVDRSAPPERIAAAVLRVLQDPQYRRAARHFAAVLAEEARTGRSAADEAEALLGSG
jgi:MGT family glycosyltransferase